MAQRTRVNFKGLEKFKNDLEKLNQNELDKFSESAIKELAARMLRKVIKRTPVGVYPKSTGKKGGTLRRGWTVGNVKKTSNGFEIEVINPTEYASYVEFGHRTRNHQGWVEGRFMLTISEQELEADAPRILENKFKKFLGELFNA
jgi:HK97 gp10 family phage protein